MESMPQENRSEESIASPEKEYAKFEDICHKRLGITTQVGSFYLKGLAGYPNFGEGLKLSGNPEFIHSLKISNRDGETFAQRIEKYREEQARPKPRNP